MTQAFRSAFRVASYNIRAGLGTDLKRDPMRSLSVIAGLDADIVALQEADFRLGQRHTALPRDAIQHHTGLVPLPVPENAVSIGWHGIAVLARPELALADVHRIDLPGLEPRGAVIVDFAAGLRIAAVHLGLLRRNRRSQLSRIREVIEGLPPLPTVIMGDFNEWSHLRGLEGLDGGYNVLAPQKTFPSRMPVIGLDRVAHCASCEVVPLPITRAKGHQPSDHLPILAEVRV